MCRNIIKIRFGLKPVAITDTWIMPSAMIYLSKEFSANVFRRAELNSCYCCSMKLMTFVDISYV